VDIWTLGATRDDGQDTQHTTSSSSSVILLLASFSCSGFLFLLPFDLSQQYDTPSSFTCAAKVSHQAVKFYILREYKFTCVSL
jgi:hypothetical protein